MKRKHLKKKIGSLVLATAMIITSFPAFGTEVQAAEARSAAPSQFATKEQLKTFNTNDNDGSTNPAKLRFGNSNQEWWIAGCQSEDKDSVTLFAASSLAEDQPFREAEGTRLYDSSWGCTYSGENPSEVNENHYGTSPLRTTLKSLETSYFSTAEQGLMKETTVRTNDTKNSSTYTTTDKLYLAYGDESTDERYYITVGENQLVSDDLNNGLRIDKKYWVKDDFWLRAPYSELAFCVMRVYSGSYVGSTHDGGKYALVPAFELDLSSVLFASAAKAASSETANGTIADGTAMTLRLDGADKTIGTALYDVSAGKIEAQKAAGAAGIVSLVVQGNNGSNDWYYSVPVEETKIVTKEQIQTACGISGVDLAKCKIWLETPAENGSLAYARMAEAKRRITGVSIPTVPSSKVFANYYTAENVLSNTNSELGRQTTLTLEGSASPNTKSVDVVWALANSGSAAYNATPGAGNTFRWTIAAAQIKDYDASGCTGYDSGTGTISGTVVISNKAGTPVTITGSNQTLNFDGSTIDVSQYFTIDANAGAETYSLVSGTGVTGQGSLSGAVLTVTKPGVFQVKLTTAVNGNYAAGEKTITLTVNYFSGAVTLASGKTVVREDETVKNDSNGTVTIDKGNNGTVDVTVKLPQAGSVNIDAEGKVTVPANGTVQATGGKILTLLAEGTVDKDGNVEAEKIKGGDITATAPSGEKVKADKAGKITIPAGGTVQTGDGEMTTLPNGGIVDKDGKVEAIKTDAEKVAETKNSVEKVLTGITVTNGTTKEDIQNAINTALTKAGISDATVTVGDLSKTEATTSAEGSISGNVTIKCGNVTDSVAINKIIDKLPAHIHIWTWVITKAATADEDGEMTGTCTCGERTTAVIPKTGEGGSGTVIVKEDEENECKASFVDKEDVKGKVSLTDEEKEHLNTGEDLVIILRLKDVNVAVDTSEKTEIRNEMGTNTLGTFLDIELLKQIGGTETKIEQTTDKITVTFEIPEHIRNTDAAVTRTYRIMRNHNGVVEILDVESYDEATHLLTFKTDKFSTYALVYQDKKSAAKPTVEPTTKPTVEPTVKPPVKPTKTPRPNAAVSPEEVKKNSEKLDSGISAGWKGNSFGLGWQAVQGAKGYDIFAARCGKKLGRKSLVKTVKGKKTSVSLAKIAGKKLSGKKNYKVRIKAWKYVGGKKVYIGSSKTYHVAGRKHKKYTNAKKLKPAKKKYTLKKRKSVRLKVRIVKQSKKKKLMPKSHGPKLRYRSGDKTIATVTSKGKVRAKGKGTCYIYVTALNGIRVKIKIKVK